LLKIVNFLLNFRRLLLEKVDIVLDILDFDLLLRLAVL
jgi:hypothetical protein